MVEMVISVRRGKKKILLQALKRWGFFFKSISLYFILHKCIREVQLWWACLDSGVNHGDDKLKPSHIWGVPSIWILISYFCLICTSQVGAKHNSNGILMLRGGANVPLSATHAHKHTLAYTTRGAEAFPLLSWYPSDTERLVNSNWNWNGHSSQRGNVIYKSLPLNWPPPP